MDVTAATPRTVAVDLGFAEGPTLLRGGGTVVVSLDHQRVYGIGADGTVAALAAMDAAPNGATEGAGGRVYLAAFSGAWPAVPECDGAPGVFALTAGGTVDTVSSRPAAPNDLCFGPDGHLYVTDPVRGGAAGRLWRIDVDSGPAEVLAELDWFPNGIGFDGDDRLWVADTVGRRLVCLGEVSAQAPAPIATIALAHGKPDGFAFDADGHLVVAAPATSADLTSTVQVFDAGGGLVDVLLDEHDTHFTNVAIAADGTAFVTEARQGRLLALDGACGPGLTLHPFR